MAELPHDLRRTVRSLLRRPWHTILVVTILALGISAGVAVFTYVNGFYQPFPGANAHRLVRVFGVEDEDPYLDLSYLDFLDYAASAPSFDGLAAAQAYYAASVRREDMTEVAFLEAVSGDYFGVLDVEMSIGRGLTSQDDRPGADPVAVLSHAWWQRSFGGDSSVLGTVIYLNYRPFTVVGVAAPEFLGSTSDFRPDVWIPFAPFRDRYVSWAARADDRDVPLVRVYGRLRKGVREGRALSELNTVAAGLDQAYPTRESERRLRLDRATWIDPRARLTEASTLRLMIMAAGGLLLLVCANVANLLLSLAAGRRRELAMHAALGASRGRMLRGVLIENVLLSSLAGVVALLLAAPASARLGSYFARPSVWGANVPRVTSIDLRVVGFAVAISLLTGVLAALAPALRASGRDLYAALMTDADMPASGPRRVWGRRVPGLRDLLVSAQVALSVVLLVVAGLVLRTLGSARGQNPGFAYDRLMVTHVSTSSTDLKPQERDRFFREMASEIAAEPWVRSATVADYPPLSPHPAADMLFDGQTEPVRLIYSKVIPGFFQAMGIDLRRGRSFEAGDTTGAPDVALVNESLAARFFPGQEAVGRRFRWRGGGGEGRDREYQIVGVVRDARFRDFLVEPEPMVYFSYPQYAYPTGSALLVNTNADPHGSVPVLYRWLRRFEPHLAIVNVIPYTDVVRGFLYTQRMNAEMFSVLALLALTLAAAGIFAVINLAVNRRTREIGVRMAIGARRSDIGRLVIRRALTPVGLGLVVGLAASFALTGLVRGLLYGVQPTDPITLTTGTALLLLIALAAAYLPARRAARVDPMAALRSE